MKFILIFVFALIGTRLNQLHSYSTISHLSLRLNGNEHPDYQYITYPMTSSLSWFVPWSYPFESLVMGLIIFLMSYCKYQGKIPPRQT